MPQYNRRELDVRSRKYGFIRDTFEKVLRLRSILDFMNTQEYMQEHLLLKGGTDINLTVFNRNCGLMCSTRSVPFALPWLQSS